jgi:non-ribosomal peptide synthetase component F
MENPVRSSDLNETSVGFSMGTTRVYVLDPEFKPTPVGCIGEICVSGPTVGWGYYGDEEKTRSVFMQDPFRSEFRMYRTGDLGR